MRFPAAALAVLLAATAATAGDPAPGAPKSEEEVAAAVKKLLSEAHHSRCGTGYDAKIALLGRPAVKPLLDGLKAQEAGEEGDSIACWALRLLAEKEDLPAVRELLLAGRTNVAPVLAKLQEGGVTGATDALLEAFAARGPETEIARALLSAPDRDRVLKTVRTWVAGREPVTERDRADLAWMLERLDARDMAPMLGEWLATSRQPETILALASALRRFGDPRGVGILVNVIEEGRTAFPCRPSTDAERAAAAAPGRLCPEGFAPYARCQAVDLLFQITGKEVFDVPDRWEFTIRQQGPLHEEEDHFLARAAAAYRKWWEGSKGRLRYDAEKDRWVVGA